MLTYEYKLQSSKAQYAAIDEAIGVVQFIRNKWLRLWMAEQGISKNDLQCSCAVLAREYPFAARLNSQARQASSDCAWSAIGRKPSRPGHMSAKSVGLSWIGMRMRLSISWMKHDGTLGHRETHGANP